MDHVLERQQSFFFQIFVSGEAEVEPKAEDKNPMTGEGGRNSASCKRGGQEVAAKD